MLDVKSVVNNGPKFHCNAMCGNSTLDTSGKSWSCTGIKGILLLALKYNKKDTDSSAYATVCMSVVTKNLIHDVLRIVCVIQNKKAALQKISAVDSNVIRQFSNEVLDDIDADLSALLSTMINSPLTGTMFTPLPQDFVSIEDRETSLVRQLQTNL